MCSSLFHVRRFYQTCTAHRQTILSNHWHTGKQYSPTYPMTSLYTYAHARTHAYATHCGTHTRTHTHIGMFNNYASVLDTWTDTTNFDNVRGPAFAHDGIAVAGGNIHMSNTCTFTRTHTHSTHCLTMFMLNDSWTNIRFV